jgi:NIMA (never in mitosis gene a)-related kinase
MNEKKIWQYFLQILLSIKKLHDNKIIHRDIKSANVFLTEDQKEIRLGDLNVAKVIKENLAQT